MVASVNVKDKNYLKVNYTIAQLQLIIFAALKNTCDLSLVPCAL
jgi:hypothetical protein